MPEEKKEPKKRGRKKLEKKEKKAIKREVKNAKNMRLKGVKDILFSEYRYWELVLKKATNFAEIYGFQRVELPVLEKVELFEHVSGRESDVFSKELYSFTDKDGEKVALRPESTPGLARIYVEYNLGEAPQPIKMFWFGPLFRYNNIYHGRYRQFFQFDLEMFGEENPVADAQMILIAHNFFKELQINTEIQINSIGCAECQAEYTTKLIEFYKERGKKSKLCNDCKKRLLTNPLRLLDCKEKNCQKINEDMPQSVDCLCNSCKDHFIKVLEYLDELEIPYNLNPRLVRGLNYYNRTVFEFWPAEDIEEKNKNNKKDILSLGGGGRYDDLIESLGGKPTPACGFGIGIERIILKIKEKNIPIKEEKKDCIFIAQLSEQARRKVFVLFEELRKSGFNVRQSFTKNNLKIQLEEAARIGAKYSLILGQKELIEGTIILRDMESGNQEVIDYKKIHQELNKRIKVN